MYNYRSNQSALLTRCGTDFRHQYGIFGGESQTPFTRNATRAGSEEGRLLSQAIPNYDPGLTKTINGYGISIVCKQSSRDKNIKNIKIIKYIYESSEL